MAEFFNSTIQRLRHLQMRAMVMVVSYSGFGGIAVDAPGLHAGASAAITVKVADRRSTDCGSNIRSSRNRASHFLKQSFTDLAEGFGMAGRRRIRARHAAMTVL
jgi:hypothetical protein